MEAFDDYGLPTNAIEALSGSGEKIRAGGMFVPLSWPSGALSLSRIIRDLPLRELGLVLDGSLGTRCWSRLRRSTLSAHCDKLERRRGTADCYANASQEKCSQKE